MLHSLKDLKEFADAFDAVKDKGVAVAVASPNDFHAALKERPNFFQVKKVAPSEKMLQILALFVALFSVTHWASLAEFSPCEAYGFLLSWPFK